MKLKATATSRGRARFAAHTWAESLLLHESAGLVYFVQPVGGGLIKIGWTSGYVGDRLGALQTGSPVPLEVAYSMRAPREAERQLHYRFDHVRSHGEWFKPTKDLTTFIEGLREFWAGRAAAEAPHA
jgi:hypothetical protein